MGRRERNAADLKSGNAVDHSAPVLSQPTGLQPPVESRRLSSAQPQSGRGLGQRPNSAEGAVPLLDDADIAKLVEFFLLLDAWDRNRVRLVAPPAGFGSNKIVPARERGTEGRCLRLSEDSGKDCSGLSEADSSCRLCLIACNSRQVDEVGVGE